MAEGRWGNDAPTTTSEARDKLLDAAEACFLHFGLNKTTIDDIAAHANVSRATVYRYFDGRDEVVLGVLEREFSRFSHDLERRLRRHPDIRTAITESILRTIDAVQSNQHLALLFAPHAAGITSEIAGASEALFHRTAQFWQPHLEHAANTGQLPDNLDIDDLSEWILRITLSLLTIKGPKTRTRTATRDFLLILLDPLLTTTTPPQTQPEL